MTDGKLRGLGIGWRPEMALAIDRRRDLGFVELTVENFPLHAPLPESIDLLIERGVTVVPHGLSLSLGGAEPLDHKRLDVLAAFAARVQAPLVSEHLAFVRAGGLETGHLLPLPRTRAALDLFVDHALEAKAALPVPRAVENIASFLEWPDAELEEAEFLTEALERADLLLLLDIENLYANARNFRRDPIAFLDRIPLERIAYVHVAGGIDKEGYYRDTHTHAVPDGVLELLGELCDRIAQPAVMLERDGCFPAEPELNAELDAIAAVMKRADART